MFHICEGGKKISFLCPNGTIFQQTDLICDWWFKVNCAASPVHYAESSEVLSRAQNRYAIRESLNHSSDATKSVEADRKGSKRKQSSEDLLNDSYDFEDISLPSLSAPSSNALNIDRHGKAIGRDTSKTLSSSSSSSSHESQVFAESHSFVGSRSAQQNAFEGYHYKEPTDKKLTLSVKPKPESNNSTSPQASATTPTPTVTTPASNKVTKDSDFDGYYYTDPDRLSRRLQTTKEPAKYSQATATTTTAAPRRGTTTYKNSLKQTQKPNENQFIINVADTTVRPDSQFETSTSPPLIRGKTNTEAPNARYETPRTTPFYTPTVPPIMRQQPTRASNRIDTRPTVSSVKVAEHAMEMMKTIHDLKLDTVTEPAEEKEYGGRPGLVIPPSSGPETLHSLALYFATAVDSLVTKPMIDTTTAKAVLPGLESFDVQVGNVTKLDATLVSDSTKQQYETLFGIKDEDKKVDKSGKTSQYNDESQLSNRDSNDLETEFSNNPVAAAAGTKQIRELAQVFTHALSAYLHDPSTFRRVLAEIRPTEPPPTTTQFEFLNNRIGRTKDFNKGTGPTYLPTAATQSATGTTAATPTTEDLEVLDFSDVTASTPNAKDQTTIDSNGTDVTTTASPSTDAEVFDTTRSQILHESLKHIDHVPASRILTEALETYAINQYTGNSLLEGTTEPSNNLALEINGGLEATTNYPYFAEFDNSNENTNNDTNYFSTSDSDSQGKKPYGFGVKPANSTPIHDQNGPTESVQQSWNSKTTEPVSFSTTIAPLPLSFDLLPPSAVNKGFGLPNHEILPPVDENDLQRAQSQSIYGNGKNKLDGRTGKEFKGKSANENLVNTLKTENGHYITEITPTVTPAPDLSKTTLSDSGKINSNPWSTLSYTVFLDPLTINDGLMSSNEQSTVTPSPHTYLPQSTLAPNYAEVTTTEQIRGKYASRLSLQELAAGGTKTNENRQGKAVTSTTVAPNHRDDYMDVMQRKANEMFGGLNDTSADHLMNVMKKADKSKTVRRLILLLIQTCDDDYNTTVEQSRQALLNALIGMDGKIDDENELQVIKANPYRDGKTLNIKQRAQYTTTTQLPITTYHRPLSLRIESTQSTFAPQYLFESTSTVPPGTSDTTTNFPAFSTTGYYTDGTTVGNFDYPTTTYSPDIETTTYYYQPTTTAAPTTTIPPTTSTTTRRPVARRKTTPQPSSRNSKRLAKDLDQYLAHQGDTLNVNTAHKNSDARALELLRALYSLAGRFGK